MNSCEWFAKYDPATSSWKTCQLSLLPGVGLTPFSERWPRQGMTVSGRAYRQRMWAPVTEGIGGGLLPTPQARDHKTASKPGSARMQRKQEQGWSPSLEEALLMLPAPRTCSAMAARLDTAGNLEGERFPNLETVVAREMLPTPTTNDSKNASLPPSQADRNGLAGAMLRDDSIPTGAATYLNPSFVEEMMGFPVGWTVSEP